MVGKLIADAGGRKLFFAVLVFILTCGLLWFGRLTGAEWGAYNATVAVAFFGANAVAKFSKGSAS